MICLLIFSYLVHSKGWIKKEEETVETLNQKISNIKLPWISQITFNVNDDKKFIATSENIIKIV